MVTEECNGKLIAKQAKFFKPFNSKKYGMDLCSFLFEDLEPLVCYLGRQKEGEIVDC